MKHLLAGERSAMRDEIALERMPIVIDFPGALALVVPAREHEDP